MSDRKDDGTVYVYQPLPPAKAHKGRIYQVSGLPTYLTKDEAEAIRDAINDISWMSDGCVRCGHMMRFASDHCSSCGKPIAPPWFRPEAG